MKQSKQQIQLPRLNTNVAHILSDIRVYLKEKSNLVSITSKNGQYQHKENLLNNHNSLNYIKVSPQEKSLIQRYKQIRQIETPYMEMVEQERQVINNKSQKGSPRYQFQTHSKDKQKRLNYFRKKQKHSKSIENNKKSEVIFQIQKIKQQKTNCKQLSYCLNLVSQLIQSKQSKDDNQSNPSPQRQYNQINSPKPVKKKPKSFLRQIKKIRRQSIRASPYEPWQNNEQQYDLVY